MARIHVGWYSPHDQMFPNQSFSSIPVEVCSGVTDTRKVDTGYGGDNNMYGFSFVE